jgi:hypothetical protein
MGEHLAIALDVIIKYPWKKNLDSRVMKKALLRRSHSSGAAGGSSFRQTP